MDEASTPQAELPNEASICGTPSCPACGGQLFEIRSKQVCSQCHRICETCCEGGRG